MSLVPVRHFVPPVREMFFEPRSSLFAVLVAELIVIFGPDLTHEDDRLAIFHDSLKVGVYDPRRHLNNSHQTYLDSTYFCAYNKIMKITWNSKKAAANLNHVLLDPYALTREDSDSENEQRFITLGMGGKNRILIVVHTYRDETIRIISAWKANEPQRRRYENQF